MSKLISGKEALIALANGEDVEVKHPHDKWYENWESLNSSGGKFFLLYLLDETIGYEFRLKPRTITINGIEVPSVKYVAHSGGNCVKISCECPEDAAAIGAALRSIFNPQ